MARKSTPQPGQRGKCSGCGKRRKLGASLRCRECVREFERYLADEAGKKADEWAAKAKENDAKRAQFEPFPGQEERDRQEAVRFFRSIWRDRKTISPKISGGGKNGGA